MPPQQCPTCGRFLKNALVASLAHTSAPCPGCGQALTAADFASGRDSSSGQSDADALSDDAAAGERQATATTRHVGDDVGEGRVQDLADDAFGDVVAPMDVLEGWDLDGDAAKWLDDRPPFPDDTVIVATSAAVGAIVGAVCAGRRIRGGIVGALLGAVGAGIARKIWVLED
ncbi:MAG: hypothetical protein WD358_02925 [Nitriliruptoraceae bacterium]